MKQSGRDNGAFDAIAASVEGEDRIETGFKQGGGVGWIDHSACLLCSTARFFPLATC
jgi:hypothetical protein